MKSKEQIARKLWQLFTDEKLASLKIIPIGLRNTSFYIKSKSGTEFVLKLYTQDYRTAERIEEAGEIVEKLGKVGRPVLEMVRGINGLFTQQIQRGRQIHMGTLSKYVETQFPETHVDKKTIVNIAEELKLLHKELHKIPHSDIYKLPKVKENLEIALQDENIEKIKDYFRKNKKRKSRMQQFITFYKEEGHKLLAQYESLDESKFHLNHGDFNLNNFHIKNGRILKIFDFDELLLAPETFEIAVSLFYLDYAEEFYTDELMEIFLKAYYGKSKVTLKIIKEVLYFMKYRAFHRMARFFRHFQYTDRPGGHFTKFVRILKNFNEIDPEEIYRIIRR